MVEKPEAPEKVVEDLLGETEAPEEGGASGGTGELPAEYTITVRGVPFTVRIGQEAGTLMYRVERPFREEVSDEQRVEIRSAILQRFKPSELKVENLEDRERVEDEFESAVFDILEEDIQLEAVERKRVAVSLVIDMIRLGKLEIPLEDDEVEEVCINSADEPLWVYHKQHGWLRTSITFNNEEEIKHLTDRIASMYGKEITTAHPVLDDARLITGDRAAATIKPISSEGNTLTIRKFRREPWTMIDFISPEVNTLNAELAAQLWLAVQYEANVLIAGGTASGKTSLLNAMLMFVPPRHRVVSIEDVREIRLHEGQHWVPLSAREAPSGDAEDIDLLDLMLLSLRMRPDRIVLGEVRTTEEAQTLFEAAETGHAVYSTLHATDIDGIFRRLLNPPIDIPKNMLSAMDLALVQYRQKQEGYRRTIQAAEIIDRSEQEEVSLDTNMLWSWDADEDVLEQQAESEGLIPHIKFFSGMDADEIRADLEEKQRILEYMLEHGIRDIESVSETIELYYRDKDALLDMMDRGTTPT